MFFPLKSYNKTDTLRERKAKPVHRWKKAAALALAALTLAGTLSACAPGTGSSSEVGEPGESSQPQLTNNGESTQLTVAEIFVSRERTEALKEIGEKYMADFPQTQIEIVTVDSGEEAQALLESGEADLVELSQAEQPACVEQGLLLELSSYLKEWEETSSLTAAAQQVIASMGADQAYLLPATLNQDVTYYRKDWFEAFNEGKTEGLVYCRIWEDFPAAVEKLADKGAAGLVFGGKDHLVDLFDSILWSAVNLGRMADTAAGYFSAVEGNDTLFTLEQAPQALEQLSTLVEGAVPEEALSWTEDQAIEAFVNGEAIALIAGQDRMEEIASALGEEALGVAGYPRGLSGIAITGLEYTGFGVAAASQQAGNAVHFLTYLSNSDNNTHLAKACGTVPIHTTASDLEPSLEEGTLAVNMEMVRRANWYYYAQEPQMYQAQEGWRDQANDALGEYLSGKLSQQELLEEFDSYWSKALEDEGALWKTESEE